MNAPRSARRGRIAPSAAGYLMLLPALAVIVLLVIVPMLVIARDSFAISDPLGGNLGGFTLDNYAKLIDPVYLKTLGYSLGMALLNAVVCTVVGYIVAYYIATRRASLQPVLLVLVIIPFLTDFLVRTFAWITLLGSGGPFISLLRAFGVDAQSLVPSQLAVTLSLLYAFLPVAVFPIYASMRSIDPSLKEAAADLGAGWWQTHARVFLPLSASGLASSVMLTFVPTLGVFVIPVLLGGGKDPLVGNLIVTLFTEFRNEPLGAALSMVVLVLMLASVAGAGLLLRKRRPAQPRHTHGCRRDRRHPNHRHPKGRVMDRLTSWIARAVFLFLYLPIAALIVYSFNSSEVSYRFDGFTFRWYAELFADRMLLEALRTSAIVGLIAALLATVIGFLTAFALVRFRVKGRAFFVGAILIPLIVPEIVLGVSLLTVFSTAGIPTGLLTLVLGHVVITLPLATLVLMGAMSSLDPSLSEAATDLGASPWVTFRRVLFPLLRPSILAAFLLSFTTSFSNIVISTFTAGVGTTTLPLRIYSTLRTGLTPELNALGTLLVVATLGVILAVGVSQMRRILAGPSTTP